MKADLSTLATKVPVNKLERGVPSDPDRNGWVPKGPAEVGGLKVQDNAMLDGFCASSTSPPKTEERSNRQRNPSPSPLLLTVRQVAALLGLSERTVYRLSDAQKMPRPVKIGNSVRWRLSDIEEWIADGCPNLRRGTAGGSHAGVR